MVSSCKIHSVIQSCQSGQGGLYSRDMNQMLCIRHSDCIAGDREQLTTWTLIEKTLSINLARNLGAAHWHFHIQRDGSQPSRSLFRVHKRKRSEGLSGRFIASRTHPSQFFAKTQNKFGKRLFRRSLCLFSFSRGRKGFSFALQNRSP